MTVQARWLITRAFLTVLLLAPTLAPCPVEGQGLTGAQIEALRRDPELLRELIRRSGLTPGEIRARIGAAGYPENVLDPYLPGSEVTPAPRLGARELDVLEALGLPFTLAQEILPADTGMIRRTGDRSRVFGVDAFRRTSTQFLPLLAGPVPSDYRLGPGDVLVLILTGDVELSHTLTVTREGFVLIPQVGQVPVANLTLDQFRDVLYTRLGRVYSGVRRGAGATTSFDVSVANLRANQVYVTGEVLQPGAYQISALGTALTALYAAGGVTEEANLRRIEVRRRSQVVGTLDLYDYLLSGEVPSDTRLESGDVVFVPTRGSRIAVEGAVVRAGIYEAKPGETLGDLMRAAGGFAADADLRRLTLHRILPLEERGPGPASRATIDVALAPGRSGAPGSDSGARVVIPPLEIRDGDSLVVHRLPGLEDELSVGIVGAVRRPGQFPWREGMTLRDLVLFAGGPVVGADLRQAEIARLPGDRRAGQLADTIRVPLDSSYLADRSLSGRYVGPPGPTFGVPGSAQEVKLGPFDQVLILMQPEFELHRTVTVLGQVGAPGTYALTRKDERLTDLVRRAGGLLSTAYPAGARFYRLFEYTGLGDIQKRREQSAAEGQLPIERAQNRDQVSVSPERQEQPGAEGTLPIERPRNQDQVNVSLAQALARPGSSADIVLQPGDSLFVPEYLPTVRVSGAVVAPSSVLFVAGKNAQYYIQNAGGFAQNADGGRTVVRQANGSARTRSKFLFFSSWPEPGPGAEVFVPQKLPKAPSNWALVLAGLASILASTVSVVIAVSR